MLYKLFYKKFYKLLMWWVIIGKWKNDIKYMFG